MQGKSPDAVREYLEKRWGNEPILPVYTAASFDTGHTLEERVANYKRLCELIQSIASKSPYYLQDKRTQFFSRRPSLEEIRQCWAIASFRGEVEKAIHAYPEWGYQITDGQIRELEIEEIRKIAPLRKVVSRSRVKQRIWQEVLECGHAQEGAHLARVAKNRRCPNCLNHCKTN